MQSNVTARIRGLEEELGVALFQRHARGVTTTPAGQRLLPFVGRIAKLLADAEAAAKDEGVPNGALRLGSMETTAALRLSPVLGQFANAYPKVRLVLTTGTTSRLLEDVIEGRIKRLRCRSCQPSGSASGRDLWRGACSGERAECSNAPAI